MSNTIRVAAIIPARMASSRFPGKPLLMINGLPMVEHVRRRARLCRGFADVVVATCDQEIAAVVKRYGGTCLMTSAEHQAASDRVAEAMAHLDCTHVVNVQGDEVLVLPADLERMVGAIEAAPEVPAWNAVARLEDVEELGDSSIVKCVVSRSGRILYCARNFSAVAVRADDAFEPVRRMLGILGYRRAFLERYLQLPRTPLEQAGSIDQNRILEHDVLLQSIEFTRGYPGINEPREVPLVEQSLTQDPVQQAILEQVLTAWASPLST